jgi:hypothetical protein
MFNKKTLAAALVLASPLSFGAITVGGITESVNSVEFGTPALTTVQDFTVTLGGSYLQGDEIALTFVGADLDETFVPVTGAITQSTAGTNKISYLKTEGNVVTFRVISSTAEAADVFDFNGHSFPLDTENLTGTGTVTLTATSLIETSGAIDILSYGTKEFSVNAVNAADKANALVDVTNDRLTFAADAGHDTTVDIIAIGISDAANDGADPVKNYTNQKTLTADTKFTVNGDFSWMAETNDDGDLVTRTGYSLTAAEAAAGAQAVTIADDYQSVSWTVAGAGAAAPGTYSLSITVPAAGTANSVAKIVPEGQFTGSVDFVWGAGDDDNRTDSIADLGSHGLNATSVTAYSMPFSASVIQFLYVSNGSDTAGDVTATYTHEGEVSAEYEVGTVGEYSSTNVFGDLKAAVEAAGDVFPSTGRGDITVTVTSSDTEVLPSYYKDGDRLGLESSESLND